MAAHFPADSEILTFLAILYEQLSTNDLPVNTRRLPNPGLQEKPPFRIGSVCLRVPLLRPDDGKVAIKGSD
jgi:hypothetical protein